MTTLTPALGGKVTDRWFPGKEKCCGQGFLEGVHQALPPSPWCCLATPLPSLPFPLTPYPPHTLHQSLGWIPAISLGLAACLGNSPRTLYTECTDPRKPPYSFQREDFEVLFPCSRVPFSLEWDLCCIVREALVTDTPGRKSSLPGSAGVPKWAWQHPIPSPTGWGLAGSRGEPPHTPA